MRHRYDLLALVLSCSPAFAITPPPPAPTVFGGIKQAPKPKAKKSGSAAKADPSAALGKMMGGAGGGGDDKGGNADRGREVDAAASSKAPAGNLNPGSGSMEACGTLPPQVEKDRVEAIAFRKACASASATGIQRMAINDYSCASGAPKMYLFDADGICFKKMTVSFGNGGGREAKEGVCPKACAQKDANYTPPGFHLTGTHNGPKWYNDSNSLLLIGLEGQGSAGRGILIHGSNNPGIASSSGCSGVSHDNLQEVKSYLGKGALVYNSFSASQLAEGCNTKAGTTHAPSSCHPDGGAKVPSGGGDGGSSGATSMLEAPVNRFDLTAGIGGSVRR